MAATDEIVPETSTMSLKERLETMLAPTKLGTDPELPKLMDAQMFIRFDKLKEKWFKDNSIEELQAACAECTTLVMNGDQSAVKPDVKPKRTVVMIRDVPEDIKEDDVKILLKQYKNMKGEDEDILAVLTDLTRDENAKMWFATFTEESHAQGAALWLQRQKAPWAEDGSLVRCAMKSDHVVRSFIPANMVQQPAGQQPVFVSPGPNPFSMAPPFMLPNMFRPPIGGMMGPQQQMMKGKGKGIPMDPFAKGMKGKGMKGGKMAGKGQFISPQMMGQQMNANMRAMMAASQQSGIFGMMRPNLPNMGKGGYGAEEDYNRDDGMEDSEGMDDCTYQGEYRKYGRDDILKIVDGLREKVEIPATFVNFMMTPKPDSPAGNSEGEKDKEGPVESIFVSDAHNMWAKENEGEKEAVTGLPTEKKYLKNDAVEDKKKKKKSYDEAYKKKNAGAQKDKNYNFYGGYWGYYWEDGNNNGNRSDWANYNNNSTATNKKNAKNEYKKNKQPASSKIQTHTAPVPKGQPQWVAKA